MNYAVFMLINMLHSLASELGVVIEEDKNWNLQRRFDLHITYNLSILQLL